MKTLLFLLFIIPCSTFSQNLVANGSFEDTTSCPYSCNHLNYAVGWLNPSTATPDLMHSCSISCDFDVVGYQLPRTGNAYAGIANGNPGGTYREYIESVLSSTLIAGECYQVEYYVSAAHLMYTTDDLHVYFSDTAIVAYPTNSNLPFIPDVINTPGNYPDTMNWTLVSGEYMATGGENYLIIGNLFDTSTSNYINIFPNALNNTSFTLIDDVSVVHTPCTGIEEMQRPSVLIIPNPASSFVNISINSSKMFEFILYDNTSRICNRSELFQSCNLNVESYVPGLYFYTITNSSFQYSGKILIE